MMVLSVEECTFLVKHVFRCGGEYTQNVQQRFQAQFPETKVPHRNAVRQLIQKFKETGSMCDTTRSGRPSILTEKKVLDISDRMLQSPKKSIRKLSQQVGVSYGIAHTALKKRLGLGLHPNKITAVHELKPGDSAKRVVYSKWFLDFLDHEGEDILDVTFFTDEAYFHSSGYNNSQNSHVWCAHNPHAFHELQLHDQKIGVWVGMLHRRIVGPIFFLETLNSQWYCDTIVYPFIAQLKKDEIDKAYFQQDGAMAHTVHMSMALLDDVFADGIISKTIWPPRSPDLSPPDFFLWGAKKNSVYLNNPHTIDELKMAITEYIPNVDRAILNTVFKNTVQHVNKCLETGRGHFEHYLYLSVL